MRGEQPAFGKLQGAGIRLAAGQVAASSENHHPRRGFLLVLVCTVSVYLSYLDISLHWSFTGGGCRFSMCRQLKEMERQELFRKIVIRRGGQNR